MTKRILTLFLAVTMLFSLVPLTVFAETGNGENVTVNNPVVTPNQEKPQFSNPFKDVKENDWYYDAVQYAFVNGFFNGTSDNAFDPGGKLSRGMFVTVLARMAGVDAVAYMGPSEFRDVSADTYYAPFVAWAAKYGITTGVGNGKFDPDGLITREQMAVFFVRYFETFRVNYETGANIATVPADLNAISPWARESVLKLWKTGLLSGDGVKFNPSARASRAEAASLSMRTDKTVETWYKEPGIPSERVSVDPGTRPTTGTTEQTGTSNDNKPGDPPQGNNSDGNGKTYYKVTFVTDSTTNEQLYEKNTLLSILSTPAQPSGKVFLGWYYDEDNLNPVAADDRLTRNLTLYAKLADAMEIPEGGTPNYVVALDQQPDFSIAVKSAAEARHNIDFKFTNMTDPDSTPENGGAAEDVVENVKVANSGSGVWTISADTGGGFKRGRTYQIELISDNVVFDDSAEAFGNMKENNPKYDVAVVRFFNFSIEQNGILNMKLSDSVKPIRAEDILAADRVSLMGDSGLYLASTDNQGHVAYTQNNSSGTFTYTGNEDIGVGDLVAVYEGTNPNERKPVKGTSEKTDNGDVTYVKITWQEGDEYTYVAAEAEDVLFMPDLLPIDVDANDGTTGWTASGTTMTIDNNKLEQFIANYETMSEKTDTTVDVGDYMAFYTGDFGQADAAKLAYGEIITATSGDTHTYITYQIVSEDTVLTAMDVYDETALSEHELEAIIEENKEEIEQTIITQLKDSKFFDDAGEYLAEVTLQTDEVQEVFGEDLTLSDVVITYADGTPIGSDELKLMGSIDKKQGDGNKPRYTAEVNTRLVHFQGRTGLRAEVSVNYTFKIQKEDSDQALEVSLTAFFEQEVMVGFGVSGGIIWKFKWKVIPYISDLRMTGNVDFGIYTGIGITATAKLKDADEPDGFPWPERASRAPAATKVFNLSESIREKIDKMESIVSDDTVTASGGLAAKYSRFMEDVNKDWVDLFTVDLAKWTGAVDPLHILAYGIDVDFVVSANLNVALGITYQYEKSKRHTFTLYLMSGNASNNTIDLGINGYQLDLYVMGHIGLRAGIRAKVTLGLFSTELAGIGLQFETGAYARLWGYFYYYLENWKKNGVWQNKSGYSGALLIEIGTYLDVKFIAEALGGEYKFDPSLITAEWPLWSAGRQENVYDFGYSYNPTYSILNTNKYTIPSFVFDMYWMDLKSGKIKKGNTPYTKNYDSKKAPTRANDPSEEYFFVEMSNPNFKYNPVNNQVTIDTSSGDLSQTSTMKITWKGAPLSGSSHAMSRKITLNWSNVKDAATIEYNSNGGSPVPMIRMLAGTVLDDKMPEDPDKLGYTFGGWYSDEELTQPFTSATMPAGNTTLYAKWISATVNYTAEHYLQTLDGQYELADTDSLSGLTDDETNAVPRTYTGYTALPIKQQLIAADGSTIVTIYYDRTYYNLKFDFDNGNEVNAKVRYGADVMQPPYPTKDGYIFNDWDVAIPETMPASDATITATWVDDADGVAYTVKHVRQALDGTFPASGDLVELESMLGITGQSTHAPPKSYTGYTAQPIMQKKIAANSGTVVEVRYIRNSHGLTWNFNGGYNQNNAYTQGDTPYGTSLILPDAPRRKDYRFMGWYADEDLMVPIAENITMPDAPLALYAKWEWHSANYTVTHYIETLDGQLVEEETESLSGTIGFETSAADKGYEGFTVRTIVQKTIEADDSTHVDVYYDRNSYNLSFDDGYGNVVNTTLKYGADIVEPADLSNDEYTFMGWDNPVPATMPASHLTFHALWGASYQIEHMRQDFDGTYPEALTESEQTMGAAGKPSTAAARTYTGFTAQLIDQQTVAADGSTVVEIRYTRNSHSLTWNVNGGSTLTGDYTQGDIQYGTSIVLPAPPTKWGYDFDGWYTDANLTVPLEANATMPDEPLTLYAKWYAEHVYTIWVEDVQITSVNASDVLGDGKVSYDAGTNTLTLNNANLTRAFDRQPGAAPFSSGLSGNSILYSYGELKLKLLGNNTILGGDTGILIWGPTGPRILTIEGPGTLTVSSNVQAIYNYETYVNSGTVKFTGGSYGLYTWLLYITGGNVTVQGGSKAVGGMLYVENHQSKTIMTGASAPGSPYNYSGPMENDPYMYDTPFQYLHVE